MVRLCSKMSNGNIEGAIRSALPGAKVWVVVVVKRWELGIGNLDILQRRGLSGDSERQPRGRLFAL